MAVLRPGPVSHPAEHTTILPLAGLVTMNLVDLGGHFLQFMHMYQASSITGSLRPVQPEP